MNGYKEEQVNKAIPKAKKTPRTENNKEKVVTKKINLPYIKGTTEKIAKILRKENIKVSFSPPNSLRTMLDHAKDSINPSLHRGVYSIPCTCGKQYIGETGRSFQIILKEHIADIKHNESRNQLWQSTTTTRDTIYA